MQQEKSDVSSYLSLQNTDKCLDELFFFIIWEKATAYERHFQATHITLINGSVLTDKQAAEKGDTYNIDNKWKLINGQTIWRE